MTIKLRKVGSSTVLTVPKGIKTVGVDYRVHNQGDRIVFEPVREHVNVYRTADWQKHDYRADVTADPALQPVKPIGKEVVN